jgi:hypothetical protein
MTAPAKRLTKDAKVLKTPAENMGMHLAQSPRAFLEGFVRLGFDREAMLTAGRVDQATLEDPDAYVPCNVIGGMFECAMRTRPLKNIAMKLAAVMPIGGFPLLDYLVLTCDTVGNAVGQLSRYLKLHEAPYTLGNSRRRESGEYQLCLRPHLRTFRIRIWDLFDRPSSARGDREPA